MPEFNLPPHNKPPPLRNIATNLLCTPFPENFVAVLFTFDVEISYAVPQFLTDVELAVFDDIAFQLAPTPPAFAVCKVPQSIYDDIDFHAAVLLYCFLRCLTFRRSAQTKSYNPMKNIYNNALHCEKRLNARSA